MFCDFCADCFTVYATLFLGNNPVNLVVVWMIRGSNELLGTLSVKCEKDMLHTSIDNPGKNIHSRQINGTAFNK